MTTGTLSIHPTLSAAAMGEKSVLKSVLLVAAGTALLWASAKVQIPFYPVPMTMQTFVVLFIGFSLGSRLGALAVLAYLAEGLAGLPVFAGTPEKGIGLAYMVGPTGGFLAGFVVAAFIAGWFAERGLDRRVWTALLGALAGLAAVYVLGVAWLGALFGWNASILDFGLYPFLPAEALKLVLLGALMPAAWLAMPKRG